MKTRPQHGIGLPKAALLYSLLAVGLAACSDPAGLGTFGGDPCRNGACDETFDSSISDVPADPLEEGAADNGAGHDITPIEAGDPDTQRMLDLGEPCGSDSECESGICIETADGSMCTNICSDSSDCPEGYRCLLLGGTGGDAVRICVPPPNVLCDPCDVDIDCGGFGSFCIEQGDGEFCASDCSDDLRCPPDFVCNPSTVQVDSEDVEVWLCEPILGVCSECFDNDGDFYGEGLSCLGADCDDSRADVNPSAVEICNERDDNCRDGIDEGFDFRTSSEHCGECNAPCEPAYEQTAECIRGECIRTCTEHYFDWVLEEPGCETYCLENAETGGIEVCNFIDDDCDGIEDNGFDTENDPEYCGDCTPCVLDNTETLECVRGECRPVTCDHDWDDCNDEPGDGCERPLTTLSDCGACDDECALYEAGESCEEGACILGDCEEGFENCDEVDDTGCEAELAVDIDNCGECDLRCINLHGSTECVEGECSPSCLAGWDDCEETPNDGCETPLDTLTDCVVCGVPCALDNASESCDTGSCRLGVCEGTWRNCDDSEITGCDANIDVDVENCGGCDVECANEHGSTSCVGGDCTPVCGDGWDDCDGDLTNGCETPLDTLDNCGECGGECALDNAAESCATRECRLVECVEGFDNCDGNEATGCEINLETDEDHCGECRRVCENDHGDIECRDGDCRPICVGNWDDCDGDLTNGCEQELNSTAHCGACDEVCFRANAMYSCNTGACELVRCLDAYDSCDGDETNGCETSLRTLDDCGECRRECDFFHASEVCPGGYCTFVSCDPNWSSCNSTLDDGCEADLLTDELNCGGCGTRCTNSHGGNTCIGGECQPSCSTGWDDCDGNPNNGCETPLNTLTNCGACGDRCEIEHAEATCASRTCQFVDCDDPYENCNGTLDDGCEANLDWDEDNCGVCDRECLSAHGSNTCNLGTCTPSCSTGWGDCDTSRTNGCEASLRTLENCGRCGDDCALPYADESCSTGSCLITECDVWRDSCDGLHSTGCETNLRTMSDCGVCERTCALPYAYESCSTGTCRVTSCEGSNRENCDGQDYNGCEVDLTSLSTCGSNCDDIENCNYWWNSTTACASGDCQITACDTGYSDCYSSIDGCEALDNNWRSCSDLWDWGSIAGDTGQTLYSSSFGETWITFKLDDTGSWDGEVEARIFLDVPDGYNYNLYVYCSSCASGTATRHLSGNDEYVDLSWIDVPIVDDDDQFWIQIQYVSGTSVACTPWTLYVYGGATVSNDDC